MVHALEKIHHLLKPNGILIDIHPPPEPSSIEVRIGGQTIPAGWLHESDDYAEYEDADDALARAVRKGLFAVEREGAFDLVTHANTLAELRAYVAEEWEEARIDDITAMRAEELLSTPERDKEVILRETARIARLKRRQSAS
ncbi:MAG: hypothetical protein ACRDGG_10970 [Anaerolineae bacterium]